MKKLKAYRFEWEEYEVINGIKCAQNWGFDVVEARNYSDARKWIFENYMNENTRINYIAELKYERPFEGD